MKVLPGTITLDYLQSGVNLYVEISPLIKIWKKKTNKIGIRKWNLHTEPHEIEGEMNRIPMNSVSWHSMSFDSGCRLVSFQVLRICSIRLRMPMEKGISKIGEIIICEGTSICWGKAILGLSQENYVSVWYAETHNLVTILFGSSKSWQIRKQDFETEWLLMVFKDHILERKFSDQKFSWFQMRYYLWISKS